MVKLPSVLGKPDVGLPYYDRDGEIEAKVCQAVDVPFIADGDTGLVTP